MSVKRGALIDHPRSGGRFHWTSAPSGWRYRRLDEALNDAPALLLIGGFPPTSMDYPSPDSRFAPFASSDCPARSIMKTRMGITWAVAMSSPMMMSEDG